MCQAPHLLSPEASTTMDAKCLVKAKTNFTMDLVPGKLADVREGVREQLDGLLLRYTGGLRRRAAAFAITGGRFPAHVRNCYHMQYYDV